MKENTEWKDTEVGKIPIDWNIFKLKEKVDVIMGQSPSSNFYNKNKIGLPFMQGRTTFGDKHHTINMWTSEVKRIAIKDSVLMSVRAPVGDLNIAINELCIGRGLASLNMKNGNNEFLFYLLRAYRDQILNKETGTVFGSINKSGIENLELPFPPFLEQKKIAAILKSLDDKIELNNKMNETLEEMAQTIFKEWFVNFNFPNEEGKPYKDNGGKMVESELGMIPEGWRVGRLGELVSIQNGYAFKSKELLSEGGSKVIKIKNISKKNIAISLEGCQFISKDTQIKTNKKFKIISNDILIAMTGAEIGKVGIIPKTKENLYLNQRVGRIDQRFEGGKYYGYNYLLKKDVQKLIFVKAQGSAQPNISSKDLEEMLVAIPNINLLDLYAKKVNLMYEKIVENLGKNQTLIKIRDTLLPKLMSGEIRIK